MLSYFLFFSSDGQGCMRWCSCLLMTGFVFLSCLLFRWGVLHRVLLVVGWCRVLYSSGFLCGSSHIWSSLGLVLWYLGSWSQCSHSKGSGFDLWSEMKIAQVVCYGIKGSKRNIQKWETKAEPQTNGSYKIKQIIIKIMEYTYTSMSKVKTVHQK